MNTTTIARLAEAFCVEITEALAPAELREVRKRNRTEQYAVACATHDFLDANMNMHAAFTQVVGRELQVTDEADCALITAAWTLAKTLGFDPKKVYVPGQVIDNPHVGARTSEVHCLWVYTYALPHGFAWRGGAFHRGTRAECEAWLKEHQASWPQPLPWMITKEVVTREHTVVTGCSEEAN